MLDIVLYHYILQRTIQLRFREKFVGKDRRWSGWLGLRSSQNGNSIFESRAPVITPTALKYLQMFLLLSDLIYVHHYSSWFISAVVLPDETKIEEHVSACWLLVGKMMMLLST